ncbi:MAG TPA: hypothetical protein VG826_06215 [Pirellulales bacterium]|nr:hypothetical protein [Pirellulales bacterium]
MLIAFAVFGVWLAWLSNGARQQKLALAHLRPAGGMACDYAFAPGILPVWNAACEVAARGPEWLTPFFDIDIVANASHVRFESPNPAGCAVLTALCRLPYLEEISFVETQIEPDLILSLRELPNLRRLTIERIVVSEQTIEDISQLQTLKELCLKGSTISETDLLALARLRTLTQLDLTDARASWGDIWRLEQRLPECQITPSTRDHVYDLVFVELDDATVEAASGVRAIDRTDWPACWVNRLALQVSRVDPDGVLTLKARDKCKREHDAVRAWERGFDGTVHISHVGINEHGNQSVSLNAFTDTQCTICEIAPDGF